MGCDIASVFGRDRAGAADVFGTEKDGKPLYELARAGIEVEREARQVTIVSLETLSFAYPNVVLKSAVLLKGTYIRTLAEDMGKAFGCGRAFEFIAAHQATGFAGRHDAGTVGSDGRG